jgi:DNA-binding Xre family transcriptional regulator
MDPVDFKLGLEGLTTAVWAQLNDLYTDVLGGDMPASLADELRGVLSEREGRWMLTFWRQLAARCQASASPQGWGNGPGKATALVPPAPVGMVSSRSVTSLGAASRVRDYLRKNGLRRSEFALKVGITERTLRKLLKTGRVKVAALEQIAAAMGLTKAGLLADPAGREGSG